MNTRTARSAGDLSARVVSTRGSQWPSYPVSLNIDEPWLYLSNASISAGTT